MNALTDAIERLYLAFGDVPTPKHIDGCPCCVGHKRIPDLLATPLRDLAPNVLGPYASSALLTVGDVADYLFFLPRILEISALDESWAPDVEVTAKSIRSTELRSWPAKRREALTIFLNAVIATALSSGEYYQLDEWLCAIALMELEVRPYLAQIETNTAAVLQYFEDNAECLKKNELCNAFWERPNQGHDAIVRWFRSDAVRRIPFEAYGYVMDPPV